MYDDKAINSFGKAVLGNFQRPKEFFQQDFVGGEVRISPGIVNLLIKPSCPAFLGRGTTNHENRPGP
jgi:hypothetical protein